MLRTPPIRCPTYIFPPPEPVPLIGRKNVGGGGSYGSAGNLRARPRVFEKTRGYLISKHRVIGYFRLRGKEIRSRSPYSFGPCTIRFPTPVSYKIIGWFLLFDLETYSQSILRTHMLHSCLFNRRKVLNFPGRCLDIWIKSSPPIFAGIVIRPCGYGSADKQ